MGFQLPVTIADTIKRIHADDLVLPAIQREFVWEDDQITRLFDSVARGYPIGSFLSWAVGPEAAQQFRFYGFLREYHQKDNPHCPVLDPVPGRAVTAVLDGQQRLTALNIGLRGSYASRVRAGRWTNPKAFPTRRLYVNALAPAPDNDLGMVHDFRLLTDAQVADWADDATHWFPLPRLYEIPELVDLMGELAARDLGNHAYATKLLGQLHTAIHSKPAIYFYEETDQDVEKVLDIFIRVNSGGTVLSYSDLLLSIATAQWSERDARKEIQDLVDTMNATGDGFRIPKDTVLKAGLLLIGTRDFAFKVRNFNHSNMAMLQQQWSIIADRLSLTMNLLADFGLSEATLTANSVIIPVAHYVAVRDLTDHYRTSPKEVNDRARLKSWVLRSLVKQGIWGSGLDTLLRDLRDVITAHGESGFPADAIDERMAARGKSLAFSDAEIDELCNLEYKSKRTFSVLALLFPHVDTRNHHHVDHVYPRALLTPSVLRKDGRDEGEVAELSALRDLLPNLQLLEGLVNISKSDTRPLDWARQSYGDATGLQHYLDRNDLGLLPASSAEFKSFFDARKAALRRRLVGLLGGASEPAELRQAHEPVATREATVRSFSETEDELSDDLLERISSVVSAGGVISTLSHGKPNRIVSIGREGVSVETEQSDLKGSGPQLVSAKMLNIAWSMLEEEGQLDQRELVKDVKRSAFIVALFSRFPDVHVESVQPTVLRLR